MAKNEAKWDEAKAPRDKAKEIRESKMPDDQKQKYLQDIGAIETKKEEGFPFEVYARIRKIPKARHSAMQVYPKAKGVRLASLTEWDEIFKQF